MNVRPAVVDAFNARPRKHGQLLREEELVLGVERIPCAVELRMRVAGSRTVCHLVEVVFE